MTTLMHMVNFTKERCGIEKIDNAEIGYYFDKENATTLEDVLKYRVDNLLLRRKRAFNPWFAASEGLKRDLDDKDVIELNDKG